MLKRALLLLLAASGRAGPGRGAVLLHTSDALKENDDALGVGTGESQWPHDDSKEKGDRGHELAEHMSEIGMCNSHIMLASKEVVHAASVISLASTYITSLVQEMKTAGLTPHMSFLYNTAVLQLALWRVAQWLHTVILSPYWTGLTTASDAVQMWASKVEWDTMAERGKLGLGPVAAAAAERTTHLMHALDFDALDTDHDQLVCENELSAAATLAPKARDSLMAGIEDRGDRPSGQGEHALQVGRAGCLKRDEFTHILDSMPAPTSNGAAAAPTPKKVTPCIIGRWCAKQRKASGKRSPWGPSLLQTEEAAEGADATASNPPSFKPGVNLLEAHGGEQAQDGPATPRDFYQNLYYTMSHAAYYMTYASEAMAVINEFSAGVFEQRLCISKNIDKVLDLGPGKDGQPVVPRWMVRALAQLKFNVDVLFQMITRTQLTPSSGWAQSLHLLRPLNSYISAQLQGIAYAANMRTGPYGIINKSPIELMGNPFDKNPKTLLG